MLHQVEVRRSIKVKRQPEASAPHVAGTHGETAMALMLRRGRTSKLSTLPRNHMAEASLNSEKVVASAHKNGSAQLSAAVKLEHAVVAGVKKGARRTGKLVKEHPMAAAGVMLGAGVVVGAVAHRVLAPRPGVGKTMLSALKASAKRVSKQARRAMK